MSQSSTGSLILMNDPVQVQASDHNGGLTGTATSPVSQAVTALTTTLVLPKKTPNGKNGSITFKNGIPQTDTYVAPT